MKNEYYWAVIRLIHDKTAKAQNFSGCGIGVVAKAQAVSHRPSLPRQGSIAGHIIWSLW